MIVVVDDEDRENEGDLTLAAEKVTPEAINFMAKYGHDLVCLVMSEERLEHLRTGPMTAEKVCGLGPLTNTTVDFLRYHTMPNSLITFNRFWLSGTSVGHVSRPIGRPKSGRPLEQFPSLSRKRCKPLHSGKYSVMTWHL
jgi:3,4-dihydroxy 2-butanone 4-phosphate synthase/GTP cyclohydrolase II